MWQQITIDTKDLERLLESFDRLPNETDVAVFISTAIPYRVIFSHKSFDKISRLAPILKKFIPIEIEAPIFIKKDWNLIYGISFFK